MLNYKNINTLAGVLCQEIQKSSNQASITKFNIAKTELGSGQFELTLTGVCHSSIKNKQLDSLGEELNLAFYSDKDYATGTLGLHKIKIKFKNQVPLHMEIQDALLGQTKRLDLNKTRWSKNNMIVTQRPIFVSLNHRAYAKEKMASLEFRTKFRLYNIWNYEAFGCSASVPKSLCEKLSEKL